MISIQSARKWHLLLVWPALICVLIYTLSALTHPLMAWTGPQATKRFPPTLEINSDSIRSISKIIKENQLTTAKVAKFIQYTDQALFQITEDETSPRRYFSTVDFKERLNHDEKQAIWLAQHYLSKNSSNQPSESLDIKSVEFKTQFDSGYPSVNRLLPVYKINYNTNNNLTIFIHTETQAVAGITNDWKRSLRKVFQLFHTFSWLDEFETLRLILTTLMVSIITLMAITSFVFIIRISRKNKIKDKKRRWHRRIAYVVTIPLFLFSISGIYHLLHSSLSESVSGLRLNQNLELNMWKPTTLNVSNLPMNTTQISLLNVPAQLHNQFTEKQDPSNQKNNYSYYRVSSLASTDNNLDDKNTRQKRFKGTASESHVTYINAEGIPDHTRMLDKDLDKLLAAQHAKEILKTDSIQLEMITHFGPEYDFRNKRLPVWMAISEGGERVFIDPISQILVDRSNLANQIEGYSFSFLHKWNLFTPLLGRFKRDMFIIATLSLILLLSVFGLMMYLKNRKIKQI
jgi:hypothetical protein